LLRKVSFQQQQQQAAAAKGLKIVKGMQSLKYMMIRRAKGFTGSVTTYSAFMWKGISND